MIKQKHYFLGGNTAEGFFSFYNYILPQKIARRIICIKGGPGTGKSSLMKRVGNFFSDKGYEIEFHHCSSDNNSIDGMVIKELNVALLDGTSPHMVDPITPGAIDEILNMGECWNEDGFKDYRDKILSTKKEISTNFNRAYRFLASAKNVYEDWLNFNQQALNLNSINLLKENLKNTILDNDISNIGYERHLFATAFTPNGVISYIQNLIEDFQYVYVLKGGPGCGKTDILKYLYKEAVRRGLYVEVLHAPLMPDKLEHILIPELSTAIITSNEINKLTAKGIIFDMNDYLDKNMLEKNKDEIEYVKNIFYILLNKGLSCIEQAKFIHDKLESYYIPNMDFEKMNLIGENIIDKILKYEKDYLQEKNNLK